MKYIDTFLTEVSMLKILNSNYTPKLIDAYIDDKGGNIITPYCGVPLYEVIPSYRNRDGIISQLLRATCDIHSSGVVHCDIKPNNILMFGDELTVIDFGVSKLYKSESDWTFGTFPLDGYGCPEAYLGYERLSKSSDMWGVGCVLHDILEGRRLFSCQNYLLSVFEKFGLPSYLNKDDKSRYISCKARSLNNTILKLLPFFHYSSSERINCYSAYELFTKRKYEQHQICVPAVDISTVSSNTDLLDMFKQATREMEPTGTINDYLNIAAQLKNPIANANQIVYLVELLYGETEIDTSELVHYSELSYEEFLNSILNIIKTCDLRVLIN